MRSVASALAVLVLAFAAGCAGRSTQEVAASGGTAGAGGTGDPAGSGGTAGNGAAGAPACAADLQTDTAHCGRCFHSCEGGDCFGGRCQPVKLVSTIDRAPTALAVDPEYVWYGSPISRVGKELGNRPERMAMTEGDVWSLAVDDRHVYWVNVSPGLQGLNYATGESWPLAEPGYRVVMHGGFAYVTGFQWILKVTPGELGAEVLAEVGGEALAVDDFNVYFTRPNGGGLFQVPNTGGDVVQLTKDTSSFHITAWEGSVYVSDRAIPAGVFQVSGPGSRVLVASLEQPAGIVADSFGLFWADWADGSIWMRSHEYGSVPVKLASGQPFPRNVAVDSRAVYWTNDDTTLSVMKLAKP
jgi:hypothetical protein